MTHETKLIVGTQAAREHRARGWTVGFAKPMYIDGREELVFRASRLLRHDTIHIRIPRTGIETVKVLIMAIAVIAYLGVCWYYVADGLRFDERLLERMERAGENYGYMSWRRR